MFLTLFIIDLQSVPGVRPNRLIYAHQVRSARGVTGSPDSCCLQIDRFATFKCLSKKKIEHIEFQ